MIGIKPLILIHISKAVLNNVHRNHTWCFRTITHPISPGLKPSAVTRLYSLFRISIQERPTVINGKNRLAVNQIKTIITVIPRTTPPEYIARILGRSEMSTESIYISTFTAVGYRIIIIIGIAIQHQIVLTRHYIEADRHTVMHRQMFVDIITSTFIAKTFGLGMSHNSYLCSHHLYISEMQIRATYIKHNNTFIFRLYRRKVKNRTLIFITGVTNSFVRSSSTL